MQLDLHAALAPNAASMVLNLEGFQVRVCADACSGL